MEEDGRGENAVLLFLPASVFFMVKHQQDWLSLPLRMPHNPDCRITDLPGRPEVDNIAGLRERWYPQGW